MQQRIDFTITTSDKIQRYVLEENLDCEKLQSELEQACKEHGTVSFKVKNGRTITMNMNNVLSWTFIDITNVQQKIQI